MSAQGAFVMVTSERYHQRSDIENMCPSNMAGDPAISTLSASVLHAPQGKALPGQAKAHGCFANAVDNDSLIPGA
eukprot:CAMPEP_0171097188 /NCGR_PEP_ID=MMETSP0766_2-20121228/47201_1 /TAXON_ID=439317 /ORGANISM="Gambierdiscus australes, Strain CAWD 149" /LENGTH=74 /DNA_ID=CAMNT_0011556343 /DNA_START=43 /DNA_END=267 /DNA_ORIENTATION=+